MTDRYEMPHARADECPHAGVGKACRPCRDRFERAPITPDERATMRERARWGGYTYPTDILRLLDALDTAEAEAARLLAERTAAHADDATCASCTHEYVADMEKRAEEAEAKAERQRDRLRAREEQVRRLRAEVTRLHALVADLRAAPVWDEDTAAERAFRAAANAAAYDETWSEASEHTRDWWRMIARAVVREHLPVSGESRATVQAEALRNVVEKYAITIPDALGYKVSAVTTEDLLDRADRLEKGTGRG